MSALDDWFAKNMPDAERWLADMGAEPVTGRPIAVPMGEQFEARKFASGIVIPDELLMDAGLIPDTRPPRPPLPWRWRLRNKIADLRERTAQRAYKIIAGEWPNDGEDDW